MFCIAGTTHNLNLARCLLTIKTMICCIHLYMIYIKSLSNIYLPLSTVLIPLLIFFKREQNTLHTECLPSFFLLFFQKSSVGFVSLHSLHTFSVISTRDISAKLDNLSLLFSLYALLLASDLTFNKVFHLSGILRIDAVELEISKILHISLTTKVVCQKCQIFLY